MAPPSDEPTRRRLIATMFGTNAVESTSFIGVATVTPIVAADLAGTAMLAGIPSTLATFGTASGALGLGWLGARIGRRRSFALGYALAALAAGLAATAIIGGRFLLFAGAVFLVGMGRSASQLARYAAGDLREEDRRGTAIGIIVWAATIGSVLGPLLIGPAGDWAASRGLPDLAGPVLLAGVGFTVATIVVTVLLRPDPLDLAVTDRPTETPLARSIVAPVGVADVATIDVRGLLRRPSVRLSFVALATSQLVMVLVMTMTPLHMRGHHHHLEAVGWVMMAHTLGMFAIAPLTGRLVDRFGARWVMGAGGALLAVSCLGASTARGAETPILILALFGLGVGWNFGFVAASTHLQTGLALGERVRLQGLADATTWGAGGIGAAVSGVVLATLGYPTLGIAGAALAMAIPLTLVRTRGT